MLDRNSDDGQRGQDLARISHAYGRCPKCELFVPLVLDCTSGDPVLGIPPVYSGELRCGLCAMALVDSEQRPLDLRRNCPDCGSAMRAPADAVIIACPGCDAYFFNPANSPDVRARVEARLAERARLAEMVAALDRRLAEAQASMDLERWEQSLGYVPYPDCSEHTDGLYGEAGPCVLPLRHAGPCSMYSAEPDPRFGPARVPEEWIDRSRPPHEVFVEAFVEAVQGLARPREQRVVTLRYGLDGKPGRTFRQIAEDLGRSPSRARDLLWQALSRIRLGSFSSNPQSALPAEFRARGVVAHLAAEVLGDGTDAEAPARVRAFVDQALPNVHARVAAKLLIELASLDLGVLVGGRNHALCRAVAAVRHT